MSRQRRLPLYHAQVLRMWAERPTHRSPVWRFSLEHVDTGQRRGFADLDALITHLLELMEGCAEQELVDGYPSQSREQQ